MPESPPEPTTTDRVRGAAARALGRLPAPLQDALADALPGGPAPAVDGQRLDPAVRLLLALNPDGAGNASHVRADPVGARARLRREVLGLAGRPTAVGRVQNLVVGGAAGPLDARLYRPAHAERPPLVVYFHGGGYTQGDLDTHDEPCRLLCRQAGHAVLSVDYRLAPEARFPAAVEDAEAAFRWARDHAERLGADPGRVAVGGDSAGGALAAVTAQAVRGRGGPVAQLLIYPSADHPTPRPSRTLFDGYILPDALRRAYFDVYTRGTGVDDDDPRLSPISGRLDGLAPAFVVTAGFDVLRDEGEAYARALDSAGGAVALYRQAALPHGFVNLTGVSPAARRATVAVARRWRRFLAEHAAGGAA
ncbi:alpha/beta hydrolase [Rubrivirga sp. S365]|uniref:Alpha/beta hydrolase n=1 Tax=Rubrivirga litoralis TaxID=3075598 RepID=A0ABU3BSV5_9BACT|nr:MULTISPECIES: alpha/beta hydrolase [unclassified Rubrivirga]MDT0632373.1 alpha/beta hydrolase [Rubrivirga sp. F394]MDT7857339.1 alpha/beta hydrolase [Rubrivirga sp. S365]